MSFTRNIFALLVLISLGGCQTATEHRAAVQDNKDTRLTVGSVQREVRVGMSGADVIKVMGSPNIVSSDDKRLEVWVYDKISTERAYSTSSGGISALILAGGIVGATGLLGGVAPSYSSSAGAASTSQRTLTVIIKFGSDKKVKDFSYHSSRF
jgi:outer membrane protein assembly factor BamE (lipoprotein component of BamABCDE complex)